ncbi:AraC family transcriptional regulator (plasmid) [Streptomycetaceae bacterium NBC_01309]
MITSKPTQHPGRPLVARSSAARTHGADSSRDASSDDVLYRGLESDGLREALRTRLVPLDLRVTGRTVAASDIRVLHRGELSAFSVRCGADMEIHIAPDTPAYLVIVGGTGRGHIVSDQVTVPLFPAVTGPGRRVVIALAADAEVTVLRLRRTTVEAMAYQRFRHPRKTPLRFAERMDPLDAQVRQWLGLVDRLCGVARSQKTQRPLAATAHLERVLVNGLLEVQPLVRWHRPTVDDAQAFCEPRLGTEITVRDIAEAVGVSVRTLQAAFREGLGTTPTAHVRDLRLARAHASLLAAAAGRHDGGVREIARQWGFWHLGRFSALYRSSYGQLPSHTMRFGTGS